LIDEDWEAYQACDKAPHSPVLDHSMTQPTTGCSSLGVLTSAGGESPWRPPIVQIKNNPTTIQPPVADPGSRLEETVVLEPCLPFSTAVFNATKPVSGSLHPEKREGLWRFPHVPGAQVRGSWVPMEHALWSLLLFPGLQEYHAEPRVVDPGIPLLLLQPLDVGVHQA
jgi:hypothetical protein